MYNKKRHQSVHQNQLSYITWCEKSSQDANRDANIHEKKKLREYAGIGKELS